MSEITFDHNKAFSYLVDLIPLAQENGMCKTPFGDTKTPFPFFNPSLKSPPYLALSGYSIESKPCGDPFSKCYSWRKPSG